MGVTQPFFKHPPLRVTGLGTLTSLLPALLYESTAWKQIVEVAQALHVHGSDEVKMAATRALDHWQRGGFLSRREPAAACLSLSVSILTDLWLKIQLSSCSQGIMWFLMRVNRVQGTIAPAASSRFPAEGRVQVANAGAGEEEVGKETEENGDIVF